jgi:uncharacterized protein with HEPN domain
MTSSRSSQDYLQDILSYANDAIQFVGDMDFAAFEADKRTHYAVIRALEIIGEATKNISQDIRDRYPNIPWRLMAGMRDKLIHNYMGADLEKVFETVQTDLPEIKVAIVQVIEDQAPSESG